MGWRLPKMPEQVPVFAAVETSDNTPRRHGLLCSRLVPDRGPTRKRHGLPVDAPEEILLRAARELGVLDLVIIIDSALEKGDIDRDRMEALLASRRPGVRMLRKAYDLATPKCESAGETVLRLFHSNRRAGRTAGRAVRRPGYVDRSCRPGGHGHDLGARVRRGVPPRQGPAPPGPAPRASAGRDAVRPARLHPR